MDHELRAAIKQRHRALIADLGGPTALAKHLQIGRTAVSQWYHRDGAGIPPLYRPAICKLAAQQGVETPPGFDDARCEVEMLEREMGARAGDV